MNNSIQNALGVIKIKIPNLPDPTVVIVNNVGPAGNGVDTVETSSGSGDASKVPELNTIGKLDMSFLETTTISNGSGSAGQIPVLNSVGQLDVSALPTNLGTLSLSITASEMIYAGALVNVWNNNGISNARLANGSIEGRNATGYVLSGVPLGAVANVYFEGVNTAALGLTPGTQYLSSTVAGASTNIQSTTTGTLYQIVGIATNSSTLIFQAGVSILL